MATTPPTISSDFDDHSRPDTPLASQHNLSVAQIPTIETPESPPAVNQTPDISLADTLKLPSSPEKSTQFLLPIPAQSPSSKPQYTFSLSDLLDGSGGLETLGPEIASAAGDIVVAADGSFIETSSGPAARDLKRRYDQLAGVGLSVRSPYAITAFVSQHGKSMYRIGHRGEHSAPAAGAAEVEERIIQSKASSEASNSPRPKRRSRLSMHFLQPAMFTKSTITPTARPPTAASTTSNAGAKKLRKTRSIPDMSSPSVGEGDLSAGATGPTFSVTGRGHSQSVTAVDIPRYNSNFNSHPPDRKIDAFADLMDWHTPSSSISSHFSSQSLLQSSKASAQHQMESSIASSTTLIPFGPGVTFVSPALKSFPDRLPTPRHLREMQSFESGMTARQVDSRKSRQLNDSPVFSESTSSNHEMRRPPSAIRLSLSTVVSDTLDIDDFDSTLFSLSETHLESEPESESEPEPDVDEFAYSAGSARLSSAHTVQVYNVLQTYRGLPLFDSLVPESEGTAVIKLSLAADQSAAPRDDPRFVIWGEVQTDQDPEDYHSASRDSLADFSSSNPSSSMSKRRSSKVNKTKSPEPSIRLPAPGGQRVLLAATIERWIAQLTSDLNYDELLNFFLTYRNYVSAVDVCNFLICRFHWALQKPSSTQDETVRRIVRVRTFVAIRYWLLTFFTVDFIPNRELRLLIADWLNTMVRDPKLKQHNDGIGIIRRLVKVAKECKRAHTRATDEKPKPAPSPKPVVPEVQQGPAADHLLGKSFAEAIRKPVIEEDESILDLDFLPDDANLEDPAANGFPTDHANKHLTVNHVGGGGALSPSRPTSLPLSSFNILQRTDHAPGPSTGDGDSPFVHQNPTQVALPLRHSSAFSRAFVKTIGRIGRWKRVLNPRSSSMTRSSQPLVGPCGVGVSAFDLELNASRDLLTMNGGVEQYLKMTEPLTSAKSAPLQLNSGTAPAITTPPASAPPVSSLTVNHPPIPPMPTTPPPVPHSVFPGGTSYTPQTPVSPGTSLNFPAAETVIPSPPTYEQSIDIPTVLSVPTVTLDPIEHSEPLIASPSRRRHISQASSASDDDYGEVQQSERAESFRSSSTDSFGAPLTSDGPLPPRFPGTHAQWEFDVVSIDELDFSDTSSIPGEDDLPHPPGLKPSRKLPMRRDFEFVRRSEVSSMGIISHESLRDSISSSTHSESSPTSSSGPRPIHRWQMKSLQQTFESLSNDGEGEGDVEAALRRLEGQINPKIQQEKADKVDGWVRTLQQRMQDGDYDYASSLFSEDEVEGFIDEVDQSPPDSDFENQPEVIISSLEDDQEEALGSARTPMPTQTAHHLPSLPLGHTSPVVKDAQVVPDEAVPIEILQSRVSTSEPEAQATHIRPSIETVLSSKFSTSEAPPRMHRSFVHNYRAEVLAEHFSMIDRELFISVKFEELVTDSWMECDEIDVLDWAQFLKDRARWRAESRCADKTTALAAVRARFNLMVNFVVAEIVLTPPTERPFLVNKFIRIAWKLYSFSNFSTLTAIIAGLQNEWVTKAMRRPGWSRIGSFEMRMFRDLKLFTANVDDFKYMRQIVDSIVDAKPLESNSHAASVISGGGTDSQSGKGKAGSESRPPAVPSACIPFIGVYLTQLHRLNKLPAVIDPTTPHSLTALDTVNSVFQPLANPEVFSSLAPLPSSMSLEVLINVHKQRRIADVIKSLVAGQHLASRVHFEVDKKLFQRCLRLRGLDPVYLQRALAMYPE